MLTSLFFIKLLVAVSIVVGLSLLAEHVSPKIAGILAGFPTSSAIALFFFGLEQSPEFAAKSAIYNMIGLAASMCFTYAYYRASLFFKHFSVLLSSIFAIFAYFTIAWLLHFVELNKFFAMLIPMAVCVLLFFLLRKIKDTKIENKVTINAGILFLRALLASIIIIFITFLPRWLTSEWSGLFSAFPATIFSLMLIVHITYGKEQLHALVKNIPIGMFSLILYSLSISIFYPRIGIYWGTLGGYAIAIIFLMLYAKIKKNFKNKSFQALEHRNLN